MAFKQMISFNRTILLCTLLIQIVMLQCEGYKGSRMEEIKPIFGHVFVRRSQLNGILGETSHASKAILKDVAHSIGGKVSKAPKGKGFTIPSRGLMSKSHFNEANHNSSPKSILRHSTLSPSRSRFSNRVSFHNDKQVVHPSSSSKHSISPYGGSLGHVEEHQGSKPTSRIDRQESFKNPFGQGSSSATSRLSNKKEQISQPSRSNRDRQKTSVFQSAHTAPRSNGRNNGGNSQATFTHSSHSSTSAHHHPQGTVSSQEEKPVKGFSKVARDYPGLGFAVTGAGLIVGTTSIVTHNMRAKEDEVMRKKKELGVPPVDLSKERKAAEEKLQKQSSSSVKPSPPSNPPTKSNKPPSPPVKGPKK